MSMTEQEKQWVEAMYQQVREMIGSLDDVTPEDDVTYGILFEFPPIERPVALETILLPDASKDTPNYITLKPDEGFNLYTAPSELKVSQGDSWTGPTSEYCDSFSSPAVVRCKKCGHRYVGKHTCTGMPSEGDQSASAASVDRDMTERVAEVIYESFPYDGPKNESKPKWVENGNALRQGDARKAARIILRDIVEPWDQERVSRAVSRNTETSAASVDVVDDWAEAATDLICDFQQARQDERLHIKGDVARLAIKSFIANAIRMAVEQERENAIRKENERCKLLYGVQPHDDALALRDKRFADLRQRLAAVEQELGREKERADKYGAIASEQIDRIAVVEKERDDARSDIANALRNAKEYVPDYPWDSQTDNKASQISWALGEAYKGVRLACDDLREIISAMMPYLTHRPGCLTRHGKDVCDCGLSRIAKELNESEASDEK